ncbi:MAG: segregation/condensation protein A [bacterium]
MSSVFVPYQFTHEHFSGPLELLLELIDKEKLDITKVSLAKVTEEYLAHLNSIEEKMPHEMADFLVVATRLLYLKSSLLLPDPELEAESGFDLETQLKIYRDFLAASKKLEQMWKKDGRLFAREKTFVLDEGPKFAPSNNSTAATLREAFAAVVARLKPFANLEETRVRRVVSLAEKMEQLERMIHERTTMAFHEYLSDAESKGDVVVSFLALLELVKQRVVHVEQEAAFCDILIKKSEH